MATDNDCGVCLEPYNDEDKKKYVLRGCGHHICGGCRTGMMASSINNYQIYRDCIGAPLHLAKCPICRQFEKIPFDRMDDVIAAKDIALRQRPEISTNEIVNLRREVRNNTNTIAELRRQPQAVSGGSVWLSFSGSYTIQSVSDGVLRFTPNSGNVRATTGLNPPAPTPTPAPAPAPVISPTSTRTTTIPSIRRVNVAEQLTFAQVLQIPPALFVRIAELQNEYDGGGAQDTEALMNFTADQRMNWFLSNNVGVIIQNGVLLNSDQDHYNDMNGNPIRVLPYDEEPDSYHTSRISVNIPTELLNPISNRPPVNRPVERVRVDMAAVQQMEEAWDNRPLSTTRPNANRAGVNAATRHSQPAWTAHHRRWCYRSDCPTRRQTSRKCPRNGCTRYVCRDCFDCGIGCTGSMNA